MQNQNEWQSPKQSAALLRPVNVSPPFGDYNLNCCQPPAQHRDKKNCNEETDFGLSEEAHGMPSETS
jgi:hypothetical protein